MSPRILIIAAALLPAFSSIKKDPVVISGIHQNYTCKDMIHFYVKNTTKQKIGVHIGLQDSSEKEGWTTLCEDIMADPMSKSSVSLVLPGGTTEAIAWDPNKVPVLYMDSLKNIGGMQLGCVKGKMRFVLNWGSYKTNDLNNVIYSKSFEVK